VGNVTGNLNTAPQESKLNPMHFYIPSETFGEFKRDHEEFLRSEQYFGQNALIQKNSKFFPEMDKCPGKKWTDEIFDNILPIYSVCCFHNFTLYCKRNFNNRNHRAVILFQFTLFAFFIISLYID
jgi:hypothetical protein